MKPYIIPRLLQSAADRYPEKIALKHKKRTVSFSDLYEESLKMKTIIHELRIEKGDRVGILLDKSIEQVIAMFGISMAGAVFVFINPVLKKKQTIMMTMKGIGKNTAQNLIGSLPELGTMDNKKISALVGVAPIIKQSGQSKGFAKIDMGRTIPRQALFLATMTAIRFNPVAKEFYERLKKKGKKPMVALVAVIGS